MSLTRKMLKTFSIEDPIIEQIIEAHTETTDSLKAERDRYKAEAEKVPALQKQLEESNGSEELEELQKKYEAEQKRAEELEKANEKLKGEYDEYKAGVEAKDERDAKERVFRKLLADTNVNPKYVDVIVRATNLDDIELEDGNIKDVDAVKKGVEDQWGEFIVKKATRGAETETPPEGDGGKPNTAVEIAEQIAKEHSERLYGKSKE